MTRLVLNVQDPETSSSMIVEVAEPFERVMDLCIPVQPPASALEARGNVTLTRAEGGGRVYVNPGTVCVVEELVG